MSQSEELRKECKRVVGKDFPRPPPIDYGGLHSPSSGTLISQQDSEIASLPPLVYALTVFASIGGFLVGYDAGSMASVLIIFEEHYKLSAVRKELLVGVTFAAAVVSSLVGGFLSYQFGRRALIITADLLFILAFGCMSLLPNVNILITGRVIVGLAIGLVTTVVPVYVTDCAPALSKTRLVAGHVVALASGRIIANVISGIAVYHSSGWRYIFGVGIIAAVIQLAAFLFLPESPRWLILCDRDEDGRQALQRLRNDDIEREYEEIRRCHQEIEGDKGHTFKLWRKMMKAAPLRRALLVGCCLQLAQQISASNTLMYYGVTVIRLAGIRSVPFAIWLTLVVSGVHLAFSFIGLGFLGKIGRRPLVLAGFLGAVFSLGWLGIGFNIIAMNSPAIAATESISSPNSCTKYSSCNRCIDDSNCGFCYTDSSMGPQNSSCLQTIAAEPFSSLHGPCNMSADLFSDTTLQEFEPSTLAWAYDYCPTTLAWIPISGLAVYTAFAATGIDTAVSTISLEIYPSWAQSTGHSIATSIGWVFNLIVSASFLSLFETLTKYGTFWLYACLSAAGLVLLAIILPETKNKHLDEIEGLFAKPLFGQNATDVVASRADGSVQYVHIRGLNRDGRESGLDSPE